MPVKHGPPLADSETRIQAFESKCLRKLLHISYLEHKTNGLVRSKISFLLGSQEPLLATVARQKLAWFGHVTRHDSLCKTILGGWATPGSAEEMLDGQRQRVDIPAHVRTAHNDLLQKRSERGSLLDCPPCLPDDPIGRGTELNYTYRAQTRFIESQAESDSLFMLHVTVF